MIKNILVVTWVAICFLSCNDKFDSSKKESQVYENEISLNDKGDTNFIILKHSNIKFIIHYANNKPQGILVQNENKDDINGSHFMNDNKGVFIGINPQTQAINFVGYKYLKNDKGVDLLIDSLGSLEKFVNWEQYSNNGKMYEMNTAVGNTFKIFTIKDGEKIDSSMLIDIKAKKLTN